MRPGAQPLQCPRGHLLQRTFKIDKAGYLRCRSCLSEGTRRYEQRKAAKKKAEFTEPLEQPLDGRRDGQPCVSGCAAPQTHDECWRG